MKTASTLRFLIWVVTLCMPSQTFSFTLEQLQAGYFADHLMAKKEIFLHDPELEKLISNIGNKVVEGAAKVTGLPREELDIDFRIINSSEVNAASTAGGTIYIYTGLLDLAENNDEIAWVIGHEIAHSIKDHYIDSLKSRARLQQLSDATFYTIYFVGGAFLGAYLSTNAPSGYSPTTTANLNRAGYQIALFASIAAVLFISTVYEGYEQEKELEADQLGAQFSEAAGYDPRAFIGIGKRLKYLEEKANALRELNEDNKPIHISHFHNAEPGLNKRIVRIQELYPEIQK